MLLNPNFSIIAQDYLPPGKTDPTLEQWKEAISGPDNFLSGVADFEDQVYRTYSTQRTQHMVVKLIKKLRPSCNENGHEVLKSHLNVETLLREEPPEGFEVSIEIDGKAYVNDAAIVTKTSKTKTSKTKPKLVQAKQACLKWNVSWLGLKSARVAIYRFDLDGKETKIVERDLDGNMSNDIFARKVVNGWAGWIPGKYRICVTQFSPTTKETSSDIILNVSADK